jgi:hypothetical protein
MHAATIVSLAVLAGCATPHTPAARIQQNPALFAGLPAAAQEKIRQGQIEVGFTPDMVRLALGKPVRIVTRQTATDTTEIWSYARVIRQSEFVYGPGMMWMPSPAGLQPVYNRDSAWVDHPSWVETMRVEFGGGKVIALETLRPSK